MGKNGVVCPERKWEENWTIGIRGTSIQKERKRRKGAVSIRGKKEGVSSFSREEKNGRKNSSNGISGDNYLFAL